MFSTNYTHKCGEQIYMTSLGNNWCKHCNKRIDDHSEIK